MEVSDCSPNLVLRWLKPAGPTDQAAAKEVVTAMLNSARPKVERRRAVSDPE